MTGKALQARVAGRVARCMATRPQSKTGPPPNQHNDTLIRPFRSLTRTCRCESQTRKGRRRVPGSPRRRTCWAAAESTGTQHGVTASRTPKGAPKGASGHRQNGRGLNTTTNRRDSSQVVIGDRSRHRTHGQNKKKNKEGEKRPADTPGGPQST